MAKMETDCKLKKIGWMFSSPDETLRRELKKWCTVENFWRTSRSFVSSGVQADVSSIWHSVSSADETLCRMLDITSQTKWF